MQAAGLIVAAGRGARTGDARPKQYRLIGGKPMLRWSLEAFRDSPSIARMVVVIDAADHSQARELVADFKGVELTTGGSVRTESVRAGLRKLSEGSRPDAVLVHDAARPGLQPSMVDALLAGLATSEGVAPALACADALKRVAEDGAVIEDVPRAELRRVQTPQAFGFDALVNAYERLPAASDLEDDVAVARASGINVRLIPGEARLAKVTFAEDFVMAAQMLSASLPVVGAGFDAHRFSAGDHVMLCGVAIPHSAGLAGHSDADAAWHALTDAILGAIGEADIGEHFPPDDIRWRGASSELFLRHASDLAAKAGATIANVDITLMCEAPKIKPHREAMRIRTATVLGLPLARVSVKATTTEGLGFLGRREGLAAQASALLLLPQ